MTSPNHGKVVAGQPILWRGVVLGVIGGLCGYWGPLHFTPGANQGPVLGIFFTGPAGFAAGCGFGWIVNRLTVSVLIREGTFVILVLVIGSGAILMSLPERRLVGSLIDGRIEGCDPAAGLFQRAAGEWQRRIAINPSLRARPGWETEIQVRMKVKGGVVVKLDSYRRKDVYATGTRSRKATDWIDDRYSGRFWADFGGANCSNYGRAERVFWVETWNEGESIVVPPESLAGFLDLEWLRLVPAEVVRFAAMK